ncbi:MAG: type II toxin-antitoxin system VapB family antitoxin [Nitrospirae bacterium]|nr:type II toxin-antitoxin system VapB family antitoxin [Nitrospirota bacterium]
MKTAVRHKHLKLDQNKIDRARKYLGVKTEAEAIDQALEFLIAEKTIDRAIRKIKGKGNIDKVYD